MCLGPEQFLSWKFTLEMPEGLKKEGATVTTNLKVAVLLLTVRLFRFSWGQTNKAIQHVKRVSYLTISSLTCNLDAEATGQLKR
jgi:hypothetical protein